MGTSVGLASRDGEEGGVSVMMGQCEDVVDPGGPTLEWHAAYTRLGSASFHNIPSHSRAQTLYD